MRRMKEKKEYIITTALVCTLFLGICAVKGIFPFGSATLDTSDFEQQSVPIYYHMWDFLHGKGSLLFSWNVGGGINFSGVCSHFSLISPFSLFFLLIKRSWMENSMTFYVLIKLAAMGLSMCFFLKNCWKERRGIIPSRWIVMGAAAYALSGYTLQYYGFSWLDVAAIFPLLIYHLMKMAEQEPDWRLGRYSVSYLLCLALVFIMNIPQAYMVSFYLILFAGSYFFILRRKVPQEGGNARMNRGGILKFGFMTLLALLLSAAVFIPAARSILDSGRMSGGEYSGLSGYFLLLRQRGVDAYAKWLMLAGVLIPLFYLLVTGKKSRRHLFQAMMAVTLILPVGIEGINILWHKEPYVCFPMRYGYMLVFTLIAAAGARMQERCGNREDGKTSYGLKQKRIEYGILGAWMVSIFAIGIGFVIPGTRQETVNFISDGEELRQITSGREDIFHKVKVADASLNSNYPLITGAPAFSNYVHLMRTEQISLDKMLGYTQVWTRLSDTGGTLFSDALLGYDTTVKSALTKEQGWERNAAEYGLYRQKAGTEHFLMYENLSSYPVGQTIAKEDYDAYEMSYSANPFERQNALSALFFGEELIDTWTEPLMNGNVNCTQIQVQGLGAVYLYSDSLSGAVISVNGTAVPVPSYENISGFTYPALQNNGILALGIYEDETIDVQIEQAYTDSALEQEVYVGVLNLDKFVDSTGKNRVECEYRMGKSGIQIHADADGEQLLYLPVYADSGWKCVVNGKEQSIQRLNGALMLVPLEDGENEIILTFVPDGQKAGIWITSFAGLLLLIWMVRSRIRKKRCLAEKGYHFLSWIAMAVFFILYAAFLLTVYVIPLFYTFYRWIRGSL